MIFAKDNTGKTAIHRKQISAPMSWLYVNNYIKVGDTILDFGCGYGTDKKLLAKRGINIHGYDKNHDNNVHRISGYYNQYDVVTCNYVFNVVDQDEQIKILRIIHSILKNMQSIVYISVRRDIKKDYVNRNGVTQSIVTLPHADIIHEERGRYIIYAIPKYKINKIIESM